MSACSAGNAGHISESSIFPPVSWPLLFNVPRLLLTRDGPVTVHPRYAIEMARWVIAASRSLKRRTRLAIMTSLAHFNLRAFKDLEKLSLAAGASSLLHRDGVLIVFRTQTGLEKARANLESWTSLGIPVEALPSTQVAELEPVLRGTQVGGLFFRTSGRCADPKGLGLRLFEALIGRGGQFTKCHVTTIAQQHRGVQIQTTQGEAVGDKVVICGGFGSAAILKRLGWNVPLASERGYHLMLPSSLALISRPVAFPEHYFIATPMNGGLRLAGTAEFCRPDAPPNYERADMLFPKALEFFPTLDRANANCWMGVRPSLPDGLPAIGSLPDMPDVLYAFGHGHSGLTWAGTTAELVSSLVAGSPSEFNLDDFDVRRFG
jgi:D-amino-acid dehydrogenase